MLAIIGYSLNDTIVVFDRIRENFRKLRKETPNSVVNIALNQTLSRTLMTSITTLLVVAAMFANRYCCGYILIGLCCEFSYFDLECFPCGPNTSRERGRGTRKFRIVPERIARSSITAL